MVRKTIAFLAGSHSKLVADVADGKRFFWLGSGISRDRVPDVVAFVEAALLALRDLSCAGPDAPAHRTALLEILDSYLPGEHSRFDANDASWTPLQPEVLRESYSEVLAVRVDGKPSDYLLMEVADLANVYGSPALDPGPCHFLIAILVAEGMLKTMASGNWDALIEKAVLQVTGRTDVLDVYVAAEDARDAGEIAQLAKFHGCAVLAAKDPSRYADKIIATRAQISRFDNHASFRHMRDLLKERTTHFRSLVLGLSVQDHDLLSVFTKAAESQPWAWDEDHPAYLFAEPELNHSQEDVLENCYSSDFDAHRSEIKRRSTFGTYAQPLLAALVLEVLRLKMLSILARQTAVTPGLEAQLANGLDHVSAMVAISLGSEETRLLDFLMGAYADLLREYFGPRHFAPDMKYVVLARGTRLNIAQDPTITITGADLFALAIGLIGWGDLTGAWHARLETVAGRNMISIGPLRSPRSRLAIVKGPIEADGILASKAWATDGADMAILYMQDRPRAAARSRAGRLGAGRKPLGARVPRRAEVFWSDLIELAPDADQVAFRLFTAVVA